MDEPSTILVVDEDPSIRDVLVQKLKRWVTGRWRHGTAGKPWTRWRWSRRILSCSTL